VERTTSCNPKDSLNLLRFRIVLQRDAMLPCKRVIVRRVVVGSERPAQPTFDSTHWNPSHRFPACRHDARRTQFHRPSGDHAGERSSTALSVCRGCVLSPQPITPPHRLLRPRSSRGSKPTWPRCARLCASALDHHDMGAPGQGLLYDRASSPRRCLRTKLKRYIRLKVMQLTVSMKKNIFGTAELGLVNIRLLRSVLDIS